VFRIWANHHTSPLNYRFTPKRYFVVKILTAEVTHSHHAGYTHKLELLGAIKDFGFDYLSRLHDDFELSGPHGQHSCLVMILFGTSVQALRVCTPTQTLAVHSVKTIVALLLEGLAELHDLGIVHMGEITLFYSLWSKMLMIFSRHQGR
jgi:serine/threonine-protein kinase SRPK3